MSEQLFGVFAAWALAGCVYLVALGWDDEIKQARAAVNANPRTTTVCVVLSLVGAILWAI